MGFKNRFVGSSEEFNLDQRIFHVVCFILFVASLSGSIFNLFLDLPSFMVVSTFFFTLLPVVLYYISRVKNRFELAQNLLLIVGYSYVIIIWFYSAGVSGIVHLILFSIIIWQMAFSRHSGYIWFAINIGITSLLALSEIIHPEWVKWEYASQSEKIVDFLFTYIIMGVSTFFVVRALILNYRKEKDAVDKVNLELAEVNQKLNSTIAKMEKIDQTKNKLFSVISHDIRSVAGPIAGLSEVLFEDENGKFDRKQREMIKHIHESSKNMNSMLENLLSWARIQMNSSEATPVVFDLNELAHEVIQLLHLNAQFKHLRIVCKEKKPQMVFADLEMIRSILRNLLSNAMKFTNKGGHIEISFSAHENSVDLIVRDNGIGMSKQELELLLQTNVSFTQPGTNQEKGSGLGFIICKEFADKNNGHIHVESEKGVGSTFTLSLPKGK